MELVQFFVALIVSQEVSFDEALFNIQTLGGPLDLISKPFLFNCTNYYEEEMGVSLLRYFVSFKNRAHPSSLAEWKKKAAQLEKNSFSRQRRRFLNVDPGYLDLNKVVLASFKPGGQKIALDEEVYADPVLRYEKGAFKPFDWTFPDFKTGQYDEFFLKLRKRYKESEVS